MLTCRYIRKVRTTSEEFTLECGRRAATGEGYFTFTSPMSRRIFDTYKTMIDGVRERRLTYPAFEQTNQRSPTRTLRASVDCRSDRGYDMIEADTIIPQSHIGKD